MTLRFNPRKILSPSSTRSYLYMLAVLITNPSYAHRSGHPHQEPSRGSVRADARSSLCILSASHEPPHQQTRSQTPTGGIQRTGIRRHLVRHCVSPLFSPFHPYPSRDPRLPLALSRLDVLSTREAFPFGWGFGFEQGLGAGEHTLLGVRVGRGPAG